MSPRGRPELTQHWQSFSTTPSRSADLAKLVLIGRLGKVPELRYTKNNKEYVQYVLDCLTPDCCS